MTPVVSFRCNRSDGSDSGSQNKLSNSHVGGVACKAGPGKALLSESLIQCTSIGIARQPRRRASASVMSPKLKWERPRCTDH